MGGVVSNEAGHIYIGDHYTVSRVVIMWPQYVHLITIQAPQMKRLDITDIICYNSRAKRWGSRRS